MKGAFIPIGPDERIFIAGSAGSEPEDELEPPDPGRFRGTAPPPGACGVAPRTARIR